MLSCNHMLDALLHAAARKSVDKAKPAEVIKTARGTEVDAYVVR